MNKGLFIFLTFFFITVFSIQYSYSQSSSVVNRGQATQKNYYSSISYENIAGKLIIKVLIKGKQYKFLFDTGAPNIISNSLSNELSLVPIDSKPVWDVNGKVDSLDIVSLSDLIIGDIHFQDIPLFVSKDQYLFDCLNVDGSIGSNLLRNSIVQLSSIKNSMIITDQPDKLNLNSKVYSDLYVDTIQSSPYLETYIKGKESVTIPMIFDSGSNGLFQIALNHYILCKDKNIFNEIGKAEGSNTIGAYGLGTDTIHYRLIIPEVNINGAIFKNVNAQTTINENSSIGTDILKYATITLDYKSKKLYFEPFNQTVDLHQGLFPISIKIKSGKPVIGTIWNNDLKSKISINDLILSIDNENLSNISSCDLLLNFKGFLGKTKSSIAVKTSKGKKVLLEINKTTNP